MLPTLRRLSGLRAHSIGFIGLGVLFLALAFCPLGCTAYIRPRTSVGAMGRGSAKNLLEKYRPPKSDGSSKEKPSFVVFDAHQPAVDAFLNEHVHSNSGLSVVPASSPAGVARMASTIVTMLPSSPQVKEVYLGENGIAECLGELSDQARAQTLLIDSTTLDQAVAKDVAAQMLSMGVHMIDAPVSGGVVGAAAGTLSYMVGGSKEAFDKAKPFLDLMGRRAIHCGDSGMGLAAKICNNLLLGISMAGTAEAMLLGQSLGLSPDLLASVINTSTGKCWSSESNNPCPGATPSVKPPADRGYEGGFLSKLMAKDLNLAIAAAKQSSTPLPVGTLTTTLYNKLSNHEEFANRDFSGVFEYLAVGQRGMIENEKNQK